MYYGLKRNIENFGDIYDRRTIEYDNCEDVGEVIKKIRKGMDEGTTNYGNWQSEDIIKQVNCVPIYEWDGKFYKDKDSAEAGLTGSDAEEIVSPSDSGTLTNITGEKNPGQYVAKKGNFIMSSHWSSGWASKIALNSNGQGWLSMSDRRNRDDNWIQMETVSGDIEMIKGVVTKGRHDSNKFYVKKFKVFVSRNGDSWKQMKDSSNKEEFTGHSDSNYKNEKKNYFNEVVEAKYIRVYPTEHNSYPALRLGYIKDLSGAVNCTGGSGLLKATVDDEPWFRFTFNEAKTRTPPEQGDAQHSEGTAASTKQCPPNGHVLVVQKGSITSGPNNISVNDLKLLKDNKVYGLKSEMAKEVLPGCGVDANSPGWRSSASGGVYGWSACVKPNNKGLATGTTAYHTDDKGYRYMYRHWNDGDSVGYNKWPDSDNTYKDNTQSSNANNGSTYTKIPIEFKVSDYEKVNIIRQPCRRGTKGVLPTLGSGWTSTVCSCEGGASTGYTGTIYNITGGTEGWSDQTKKDTWANFFNNKLQDLVTAKYSSGSFQSKVNEYKVVEKEGVSNDSNHAAWSSTYRSKANTKIGGNRAWHSSSIANWNTDLDYNRSVAIYDHDTEFMPIGIRIQPRKDSTNWKKQTPTDIRLDWKNGETIVTLGEFAAQDTVKTILINPNDRKKTKWLNVFARHGRDSSGVSFRINFLIGVSGGKSIDKGTTNCKNSESRPVDCEAGWDGVLQYDTGTWGAYGSWERCKYDSGSGTSSVFKKIRKRTRVNKAYRNRKLIVNPAHGGKNNCDTDAVWYPNSNTSDESTDSTRCTRSDQQLDGNHCCGGSSQGLTTFNTNCCREGSSGCYKSVGCNSSSNARDLCYTLMKNNNHNSCHWLHSDVGGGTYHVKSFAHNCKGLSATSSTCKANSWGGRIQFT